jgi:hypothetical protein
VPGSARGATARERNVPGQDPEKKRAATVEVLVWYVASRQKQQPQGFVHRERHGSGAAGDVRRNGVFRGAPVKEFFKVCLHSVSS